MGAFAMPVYMVDFTPKTIAAILSPDSIAGSEVELDVYDRNDVNIKLGAKGQRIKGDEDMFRITVDTEGKNNQHDWNFTILRDSADRSRRKK
ncbi:MAG: hypothetical protein K2Y28_04080 [Burkholderiaceae bacterium]|jgi:hypothetical protein|nr:hypothetical protein [Burkholderiaceae bacterium]